MSWALRTRQASINRPGYILQTKPCFRRGARDSGSNSKTIDNLSSKTMQSKQGAFRFNLRTKRSVRMPEYLQILARLVLKVSKIHDLDGIQHTENA